MLKKLIFDFDGVIVESFDFHLKNYNELYNFDLSGKELAAAHLGNFHKTMRGKLASVDLDAYNDMLPEWYMNSDLVSADFRNFLPSRLEQKFIITSGYEHPTKALLVKENLLDLFTAVWGKETEQSKSKKLQMLADQYGATNENSVFITDTLGDILEANNVGMSVIAVTFGFHKRAVLEQGEPHAVCDSWSEVEQAINSLGLKK